MYKATFTAGHIDGSSAEITVDSLVLVPALSERQSKQLASKDVYKIATLAIGACFKFKF